MMNNKGFTLVELITTFAVASVVALILFNVVLSIKNTYSKANMKTNLLINQANLSNQVNSKALDENIIEIDLCDLSTYCYKIKYTDGKTLNLVIKEKSVSFGNYTYKLENGSYVDLNNIKLSYKTFDGIIDSKDSILNIKVPIKSKQIENHDFGLNFVYLYNNGDINYHGIPSNE